MQYFDSLFAISKKEYKNVLTPWTMPGLYSSFLSADNQRAITKEIYNLHRSVNGDRGYLYFKSAVPARMKSWAQLELRNYSKEALRGANYKINLLTFMNKRFVRCCDDLVRSAAMVATAAVADPGTYAPADSNVFRTDVELFNYDLDTDVVLSAKKRHGDMLAADMQNLNVWRPHTTELVDNRNNCRRSASFWQKQMHVRHYDTSNQGLRHADADRASLEAPVRGYGDSMEMLKFMADERQKNVKRLGRHD